MPKSKALPKPINQRHRDSRALRRSLQNISPSAAHPQPQSPLFAYLPKELRLAIYTYTLAQIPDPTRPISQESDSPIYRPGHLCRTTIPSLSLLCSCRLIYLEAQHIPQRSASHHVFHHKGKFANSREESLHYISTQSGASMYHLHDHVTSFDLGTLQKLFLPHLRWRRITWTFCTVWGSYAPVVIAADPAKLAAVLGAVVLPASCEEVVVDLEVIRRTQWVAAIYAAANLCSSVIMGREDAQVLKLDWGLSGAYTWVRGGPTTSRKNFIDMLVLRLCWRSQVPRRAYMCYDRVDCLSLEGRSEVKSIVPFTGKFNSTSG